MLTINGLLSGGPLQFSPSGGAAGWPVCPKTVLLNRRELERRSERERGRERERETERDREKPHHRHVDRHEIGANFSFICSASSFSYHWPQRSFFFSFFLHWSVAIHHHSYTSIRQGVVVFLPWPLSSPFPRCVWLPCCNGVTIELDPAKPRNGCPLRWGEYKTTSTHRQCFGRFNFEPCAGFFFSSGVCLLCLFKTAH